MKSDERRVYFYDVGIRPRKTSVASPAHGHLLNILSRAFQKRQVKHFVEKKRRFLEISSWSSDPNWEIFYVKTSDQRAPDASYTSFSTGNVKALPKARDEGRDAGAHVLISKTPASVNGKHIMLIEKADGMQRAHVASLLKAIVRQAFKQHPDLFQFPAANGAKENGVPKLISSTLVLEISGHPSDSFTKAINGGNLLEIEMIDENPTSTPGSPSWADPVESIVKFKPSAGSAIQAKYAAVRSFVTGQSSSFDRARIRFNDPDSEKVEVVQMVTDGTVLTQKFVKSVWVTNVSPPMPECCQTVHSGFVAKLLDKL